MTRNQLEDEIRGAISEALSGCAGSAELTETQFWDVYDAISDVINNAPNFDAEDEADDRQQQELDERG